MNRIIKSLCVLSYLALCLPFHSFSQPVVNGTNVQVVMYMAPGGYFGRLYKSSNGLNWIENTAGGSNHFTLKNTDEWSVYLRDDSRSMDMQMDLFTKKLYIQTPGRERFEMAAVTKVWGYPSSSSEVKPANLGSVMYSNMDGELGGHFERNADNSWTEYTANGTYTFTETSQNESSVFLFDASRSMSLQIDLLYKRVYVEPNSNNKRPIGIVLLMWQRPLQVIKAANVLKVTYQSLTGATGYFQKNSNGQWTENTGGMLFNFVQYNQDEWSVLLKDNSRSMDIQIDLFQKKIYVEPYGTGRRQIATITQVQ